MIRYAKPASVTEALSLLGAAPWRILAGGTDVYPVQGTRPFRDDVLDINGLAELRGMSQADGHLRIGARTTWSDIVRADLPPAFNALKLAAREVGSVQIQTAGTVAGNLCNASPAADGVPPLLVLDASVEVRSATATRVLPLSAFILGNRRTALAPDEMVTAILVPNAATQGRSSFVKLGARRYLVISIAMTAARLVVKDGLVSQAAIAVGACSAVAQRLPGLEAALVGRPADATLVEAVRPAHFDVLSPIDDVRGSSGYRVAAAREIVARAILSVLGLPARELAA
ncbi:MAG: xanthine dehydrogenase family protein subunit M [Mesorhizobium sp.]|nr:xanthine dehydrogenase family protein subunit M [Mesorhizobium sp.]